MAKIFGVILWFVFIGFAIIAGWSYLAILYLYVKRTLSLQNRLEFDWWATWGFRVAFLFLLFCALIWGTLQLFWLSASWIDYVVLLMLIFVDASLFGLLIGHFALMFYKMHDASFFKKEVRKKKLSQVRRRSGKKSEEPRRESFQDSVKYLFQQQSSRTQGTRSEPSALSVSFMKIFIFAILGSIIAFWFLHTVILR